MERRVATRDSRIGPSHGLSEGCDPTPVDPTQRVKLSDLWSNVVTTASNPSRVSRHGTQQIHVPRTIRASSPPPLLPLVDLRPTAPSSRIVRE